MSDTPVQHPRDTRPPSVERASDGSATPVILQNYISRSHILSLVAILPFILQAVLKNSAMALGGTALLMRDRSQKCV